MQHTHLWNNLQDKNYHSLTSWRQGCHEPVAHECATMIQHVSLTPPLLVDVFLIADWLIAVNEVNISRRWCCPLLLSSLQLRSSGRGGGPRVPPEGASLLLGLPLLGHLQPLHILEAAAPPGGAPWKHTSTNCQLTTCGLLSAATDRRDWLMACLRCSIRMATCVGCESEDFSRGRCFFYGQQRVKLFKRTRCIYRALLWKDGVRKPSD